MSEANKDQVGGTHYKDAANGGEQHWDMMWRLHREAWFVGCITKYVLRYRRKNGVEDLRKARHYLDKLIELETKELEQCARTATESGNPYEEVASQRGKQVECEHSFDLKAADTWHFADYMVCTCVKCDDRVKVGYNTVVIPKAPVTATCFHQLDFEGEGSSRTATHATGVCTRCGLVVEVPLQGMEKSSAS